MKPVIAIVGRPNVGKSTLVNRILGRREAVVEDRPGVTRDRVAYDAIWNGRRFTVVEVNARDRPALLHQLAHGLFQSKVTIHSAHVATYGERAVDVFYVRDGFGHKVRHEERIKTVRERLLKALAPEALEATGTAGA